MFAVLGLGNDYEKDGLRRDLKAKSKAGGGGEPDEVNLSKSALEYQAVGLHMGEFFWTFRISLGDFSAIVASKALSARDN